MISYEKPMRDTELNNSPSNEEQESYDKIRFTVVGNTQGGHEGLKRSVIVAKQDTPAVSRSSGGYDANASRSNVESKSDRSKPISRVEMIEKESASIASSRWSSAGKSVMSAILTLSSLSGFFAAL